MLVTNCITGSLAPFTPTAEMPWNRKRVQHLLRRTGFGASPRQIQAALQKPPGVLVDELVQQALELPLPEAPPWANWTLANYTDFPREAVDQGLSLLRNWIRDMARWGFREKMALFWHNHFPVKAEAAGCPSYLYRYHRLLQQHSLGNFKTLVKAMGNTPAMLLFLNGVQNTRFSPNENYARELFELFTLGADNGYTQSDIVQAARALTGWVAVSAPCGNIGFSALFFDGGSKTIFGKTGNFNYDSLHDLLFEERGVLVARFICSKLYRAFVHPVPEESIISGMAQTMLDNNFELAPVMRQLLKSEHFFSDGVAGVQIKSPMEFLLGVIRDFELPYDNDELLNGIFYLGGLMGQQLFDPPDVAGWPGNRTWINSDTLNGRWGGVDLFAYILYTQQAEQLRAFARQLTPREDDAEAVVRAITGFLIPNGLQTEEDYARALRVFKHEVPQNYFDNRQWNLDWDIAPAQVALLIQHLGKLPEFQLS